MRTLVTPPWPGCYTMDVRPRCGERSTLGQMQTVAAPSLQDEHVAQAYGGVTTTHATEAGPITLPVPAQTVGWTPTGTQLALAMMLPNGDSRLSAISDRYYR
jgi:hypothetical protein